MSFLFIFISVFVLLAILNSIINLMKSHKNFNIEYVSTVDSGRIMNFETKKSESQYKPV
ncbi:MAG: hypothetical protein QM493_06895 [Sulfurovum sp.]